MAALALLLDRSTGLEKSFRSEHQSYENKQLWSAGRLPCREDRVLLPDQFVINLPVPLSGQSIVSGNNCFI